VHEVAELAFNFTTTSAPFTPQPPFLPPTVRIQVATLWSLLCLRRRTSLNICNYGRREFSNRGNWGTKFTVSWVLRRTRCLTHMTVMFSSKELKERFLTPSTNP